MEEDYKYTYNYNCEPLPSHTQKKIPLSQQKTKERIDGHELEPEADTRN